MMDPHDALAISASVPFFRSMSGATLRDIPASGVVPEDYWPHLNWALTEAPFEMIAWCSAKLLAGSARDLAVSKVRQVARHVDAEDRIEGWLAGA